MSRGILAFVIASFTFTAGVKAQLHTDEVRFKPDAFMEKNLSLLGNQTTRGKARSKNKLALSH